LQARHVRAPGADKGEGVEGPVALLLQNLAAIDLPYWEMWLGPVIGFFTGVIVLLVGRKIRRKARLRPPPPPPEEPGGHDPFDKGGFLEQRRALRRTGHAISVFILDAKTQKEICASYVMDRSMGGLRLLVGQAIAEGTILQVRPSSCPDADNAVEVEVRHAKKLTSDEWALGCRYVRSYPVSKLLLFG
jgi:hypothetical protein